MRDSKVEDAGHPEALLQRGVGEVHRVTVVQARQPVSADHLGLF